MRNLGLNVAAKLVITSAHDVAAVIAAVEEGVVVAAAATRIAIAVIKLLVKGCLRLENYKIL